ncbi:SDR family oxidoreductase [Parvularcula flava]|uniref:SDR family oxidoreductase n=1 Tax=Aquisalinus luteolus TaxID=1566827 RepID=A0A8J3EQ55_9PROT|nr:SDR family oxidoreductase [Aquisalinus luteolus]NHK26594.1 SDR family oxidoreductase [Aquisalinus luteolus]GGH92812.1 short-chain dehydrogenase [Aquisalinus luteolus]
MGRLDGKKAFITGAAQGLGACFARMFAEEGALVALTDVQGDKVAETAEAINKDFPGAAFAFEHDVTDHDQWKSVLAEANEAMRGISVLVNNAGIGTMANIEAETWEGYRKVMDIDLDSIFIGTQAALPYLKKNSPASIINISSVAGLMADANLLSYNVAKAGVAMMSKSVALHCAKAGYEIICNSVHPVFTRTPMIDPIVQMGGGGEEGEAKLSRGIPMKRLGEPEEVGHMVVYLASDEAKFVTGSEFRIDGGMTAGRVGK